MELRMSAERVRTHLKRTMEDIVAIGEELQAARKIAGHGQYYNWLAAEFDMSRQTADNFVNVAEKFGGKTLNFSGMPTSALYLLAAPAADDVREEVTAKVEAGEVAPTHAAIKRAVETSVCLAAACGA